MKLRIYTAMMKMMMKKVRIYERQTNEKETEVENTEASIRQQFDEKKL